MQNIKGIIWDYGGTIDSRGVHWSEVIWNAYCAESVDVSKEEFRDAYVFAERELARTRHILPEHTLLDLMRIKIAIEMQWLVDRGLLTADDAARLAPRVAERCYNAARACVADAREVLDTLSRKYPMVLVSNFYGNIRSVLTDFNLLKYFPTIIESAVVGIRKPDPAIFELGVKALGLEPDEVLVVGDSLRKDILPARSLGCHTAWLKGKGWTAEEDAATDPAQIADLHQLLTALL